MFRPFDSKSEDLATLLLEEILPRVEKPSRYLGNELNTVKKERKASDLRFALAFPDLYDVGLSNLGILILYDILNRMDGVYAERAYAPAPDLEAMMRARGIPSFSWETKTPLSKFDAIGFSIQYELAMTNILTMLDLAGIPLAAQDRDDRHPIVFAGGPCVYHPEPYARAIDAIVIGDGEEAIVGIANVLAGTRGRPRHERLAQLATIPGVYVPLLYPTVVGANGEILPDPAGPKIKKAMIKSLDTAPFPSSYIVPFTQQVHDRVSMEVLRGCTQGCRFCQAGMTYRPVRERSLETIGKLLEETLKKTGYDEISLSSLSTCDYSKVKHLVEQSVNQLTPRGVAVTLPSLRTDSFSVDLSDMVSTAKKSGITFAPEAASPRLRALINKWIPDEELLQTTGSVYARGWTKIKLYFMIGHPTETDEDVEAIARLSLAVLRRGRTVQPRAGVNVGVSTFVPKPFTPFQWERQISMDETRHKQGILRRMLQVSGVKLRAHEAENSWLEGVVSRGDRRVGELFEHAWREGCRLDGWTEHFDFAKWRRAIDKWGVDPDMNLRERPVTDPLPWDHVDVFIDKKWLADDLVDAKTRMMEEALKADCRNGCHVCGVIHEDKKLCSTMIRTYKSGMKETVIWKPTKKPSTAIFEDPEVARVRFRFTKAADVALLSHLELQNALTRTVRRAEIPVSYSQGFSPHMKLAMGDALPVGMSSDGEYADIRLRAPIETEEFVRRMNESRAAGMNVLGATRVETGSPSLTSTIAAASYRVGLGRVGMSLAYVEEKAAAFLAASDVQTVKRVKKMEFGGSIKEMRFDVRALVLSLATGEEGGAPWIELTLGRRSGNLARPKDVLTPLFDLAPEQLPDLRVHKIDSFFEFERRLVSVGAGWAAEEKFDPWAAAPRTTSAESTETLGAAAL